MAKTLLRLLMIAVMLNIAACQTFQYSRGWTNGKRSDDVALSVPTLKLIDLPIHNFDLRTAETLSTLCCENSCATKKVVRMIRTNGKPQQPGERADNLTENRDNIDPFRPRFNIQLYLVPCELLRAHRRNMNEEKVQDTPPADGHFRRSLSTEYDSNNDNY